MYSQKGEEQIILRYFHGQTPGRLLDIGAWDGRTFSNTLALIERGWEAVLIEPSPGPFRHLLKLHNGNPLVTSLNVAIAVQEEPVQQRRWWASDDAVSTMNEKHYLRWRDAAAFTEGEVTVWSPQYLFSVVGMGFNFINIDIEGDSADLWFHSFAGHLIPACYCIEHDGRWEAILERGAQMGYKCLYHDGNNVIIVR